MTPARPQTIEINLPDAAATAAFAQWIAADLCPGDVVLLSGAIGAGKTHFARAVTQARMPAVTDIPSPTFTLVQRYEGAGVAIVHADLYRLTHPDEATELGLDDAMARDICLIEWPERMARAVDGALDGRALRLQFALSGDGRRLTATGPARLMARVAAFTGAAGVHV